MADELGWPALANCVGLGLLPVKPGSPTRPVPGYDIRVLDDGGAEAAPGQIGKIVIKLPLPPGALPTLWNNDEGFVRSYLVQHPGYYLTGDAGYKDEDGYFYVMSRIDDIINVAGHRLSTGGMEEVLAGHADVAECAVVGVADPLKGEIPIGLVVLKAGVARTQDDMVTELVERVRTTIGPVAAFKTALVVKACRRHDPEKSCAARLRGSPTASSLTMPATIEDPAGARRHRRPPQSDRLSEQGVGGRVRYLRPLK